MRTLKDVEKLIKRFQIKPSSEMQSNVLKEALEVQKNLNQQGISDTRLNIWRIIMKSKMIKLTAAAAVLVIIALVVTFLGHLAKPTYAIGQTIEALKKVLTVHIVGQDWDGNPLETWIKTNPETGKSDYVCIDQTPYGYKVSSTPEGSCTWDKNGNIVRKTNKILAHFDGRFEYMFEDVVKKIESGTMGKDKWVKIYTDKDPDSGENVLAIWVMTTTQDYKIYIDPDTKLPARIYFNRAEDTAQILKIADHIYYNEQVPDGIFDFEVPRECFEPEDTPLYDPNNGMDTSGLTKQAASIKAAEEYWKAIISGDWEYVHKLRPLYSAEFWKNSFSENPPAEIIKIGDPYPKRGCTGLLVPCIIRFQNSKVLEILLVVQHQKVDNYSFCVIPATWGQATEIK
jgi:hypothetical protein